MRNIQTCNGHVANSLLIYCRHQHHRLRWHHHSGWHWLKQKTKETETENMMDKEQKFCCFLRHLSTSQNVELTNSKNTIVQFLHTWNKNRMLTLPSQVNKKNDLNFLSLSHNCIMPKSIEKWKRNVNFTPDTRAARFIEKKPHPI